MDFMLQKLVHFGKKRRANLPLALLCVFFLYAISTIGDYAEHLGKALLLGGGKPARRLAAAALSLCLVVNLLPMTALAAETGTPPGISNVCEHVHDEECGYIEAMEGVPCSHQSEDGSYSCAPVMDSGDVSGNSAIPGNADYVCDHSDGCGYVEAVEGADCTHTCELCDPPVETPPVETPSVGIPPVETLPVQNGGITPVCICDTFCTEADVNPDCPICSAEGADLTLCVGAEEEKAASYEEVVALFTALPNADSITEETPQEQLDELTTQINTALDALNALSGEDFAKFTAEHSDLLAMVAVLQAAIINDTPTLLADLITGDGYSFDPDDGTLTVSSNNGTTVWSSNGTIDKTAVKKVVVVSGVTSIASSAFQDCTNLAEIELPDSLESIGGSTFRECGKLILTGLPGGVTSIGSNAFRNCTSLALTELPGNLTSINSDTFINCTSLALTELPSGVTSIGSSAFDGCTNLALEELPNGVNAIGNYAFRNCANLALTKLPGGVNAIGNYTFSGCTSLALEELPSGVNSIGDNAFQNCTNLALRSLPSGVTSIGKFAFQSCKKLALTELPGGVTSIGMFAFYECTNLTSLDIPCNTAPTLGSNAFNGILDQLIIFVPYNASGYTSGSNWPEDRVVYGAALNSLTISGGTLAPDFFPGTNAYTLTDAADLKTVTVTPIAHDTETITVNGKSVASGGTSETIALETGKDNEIKILVKNDDTDKRTYTITISRAAIPVTIQAIEGVTAPAMGAAPVTAITETAQYTGAVTWSPAVTDNKFAADTEYTAAITLTPRTGYTFTGVAENFFTVAGATSVTNAADSGTVTAVFPATTAAPIYSIAADVTGLNFGSATLGYTTAPAAQTVKVTNTGNRNVTLNQPVAAVYTVGVLSKTELAPGENATFTVRANTGLAVNTYNKTLTISGTNGTSATVNLTFAVTDKLSADKSALTSAIAAANSARNGVAVSNSPASSVASGTKFVTTAEMQALNQAIAAAQIVMDNSSAAAAEITAAVNALNSAVAAFNGAIKTGTYTGGGSSSGSSSSGDGSGSSSESSDGGTTVTPPAEAKPSAPIESEIKVESTVDANGNVTVTLPEKTVDEAIKKAEDEVRRNSNSDNGVTLVLNVQGVGSSAGTVTVNLPKTTQETIIGKKIVNTVIVVNNPDIKIGMDLSAVKSINAQANADVNITAAKQDNSKLTGDAKAAIGSRPVFELKVNYDGKQITSFEGGSVSVAIPYTLGAGEKAGGVYAVYVDGSGNVQWLIGSAYDAENKVLRFSTSHFSTYGVGYQAPADFTDIAGHWAEDDILFAVNRGLLSGTTATTFSPDTTMTRGMFVTALGRMIGVDVSGCKESSFNDVKADAYYMGYVEWAAKSGIVKSATATTFEPDNAVTREQMAVIMANYAKAIGYVLPKAHAQNTFADAANISPWASDAVKAMQMAGVLAGKNANQFAPQATATRAEAAATLRRFVELRLDTSTAQGWRCNDDGQWMYYEKGSPVKNTIGNIGGENYSFNAYGVTLDFPKKKTSDVLTIPE